MCVEVPDSRCRSGCGDSGKIVPPVSFVKRFLQKVSLRPIFSGSMDATEQETRRALKRTRNNVTEAAAALGISRQAVYLRLRRYGIRIELTAERRRERARLGGLAGGIGRPRKAVA